MAKLVILRQPLITAADGFVYTPQPAQLVRGAGERMPGNKK